MVEWYTKYTAAGDGKKDLFMLRFWSIALTVRVMLILPRPRLAGNCRFAPKVS